MLPPASSFSQSSARVGSIFARVITCEVVYKPLSRPGHTNDKGVENSI